MSAFSLDSAAGSIFVVILVDLTNTVFVNIVFVNIVFVNSTNITTNIETACCLLLPSDLHYVESVHSSGQTVWESS